MTQNKNGEVARKFYVSNLPTNVSRTKLIRIFSRFGPIISVKLLTNEALHSSGGYGLVEMLRNTNVESVLARSKDTKIDGYQIFITTDKTYTETRNDIAGFFSGNIGENLKAADDLLSDVFHKLPESGEILYGGKFVNKLKVALEMGKGLDSDTLIEIYSDLLAQKKLSVKRKRMKSSRSVNAISIPMGGQPPRRK